MPSPLSLYPLWAESSAIKSGLSCEQLPLSCNQSAIACTVAEPKSIVSACVPRPLPRIRNVLPIRSKSQPPNCLRFVAEHCPTTTATKHSPAIQRELPVSTAAKLAQKSWYQCPLYLGSRQFSPP